MFSNLLPAALLRRAGLISACVTVVAITPFLGAGKAPIRNLTLDPAADKMELFAGMEGGSFTTRMVPDDITGGQIFIENKTDKSLTVILPEAFVGIHVLKQFPAGNGFGVGLNGGQGNGASGNSGFGGQQNGQGQAQGGGFRSGMQGNGIGQNNGVNGFNGQQNGIGQGQGFFSIPAHQVAQIPYQAVCLNYGKPDPMPAMTYRMIPVSAYTKDQTLQATLRIFGTSQMDYSTAQAATWHLTDKMSLEQLAGLTKLSNPADETSKEPVFTGAQLHDADQLLSAAKKQAAEREKKDAKKPATDPNLSTGKTLR
jgi:hypothetical protein